LAAPYPALNAAMATIARRARPFGRPSHRVSVPRIP
jgi:hypothetical protein